MFSIIPSSSKFLARPFFLLVDNEEGEKDRKNESTHRLKMYPAAALGEFEESPELQYLILRDAGEPGFPSFPVNPNALKNVWLSCSMYTTCLTLP